MRLNTLIAALGVPVLPPGRSGDPAARPDAGGGHRTAIILPQGWRLGWTASVPAPVSETCLRHDARAAGARSAAFCGGLGRARATSTSAPCVLAARSPSPLRRRADMTEAGLTYGARSMRSAPPRARAPASGRRRRALARVRLARSDRPPSRGRRAREALREILGRGRRGDRRRGETGNRERSTPTPGPRRRARRGAVTSGYAAAASASRSRSRLRSRRPGAGRRPIEARGRSRRRHALARPATHSWSGAATRTNA